MNNRMNSSVSYKAVQKLSRVASARVVKLRSYSWIDSRARRTLTRAPRIDGVRSSNFENYFSFYFLLVECALWTELECICDWILFYIFVGFVSFTCGKYCFILNFISNTDCFLLISNYEDKNKNRKKNLFLLIKNNTHLSLGFLESTFWLL